MRVPFFHQAPSKEGCPGDAAANAMPSPLTGRSEGLWAGAVRAVHTGPLLTLTRAKEGKVFHEISFMVQADLEPNP